MISRADNKPYCHICHRTLHHGDCSLKSYKLTYSKDRYLGKTFEVEKIIGEAIVACQQCLKTQRGIKRLSELIK